MSAHYDRKTYTLIISCKNTHTHKYKTHIIQKVDSWNHHSIQRTHGHRADVDRSIIASFVAL